MRRPVVFSLTIVMLFSVTSYCGAADQEAVAWSSAYHSGSVQFSVERDKVEPQVISQSTDQPSDHTTVEANLPGELFDAPLLIEKVAKKEAKWDAPLQALASDWSAQLADDPDWILTNFASADQREVKGWMEDAGMRQANLQIVQRHGQPKVLGWARLDQALIAILEYADGTRMPAVLIHEQSSWKRTNAFSNDPTFHIVFATLQEHGTLAKADAGKNY